MSIDSLEVDADGYPSDAALERIRALESDGPAEWKRFMLEDFERLAEELPYAAVKAFTRKHDYFRGKDVRRIEFATCGWSGCEDFIGAVLSVKMIEMLYYVEWRRGGLHVFEVPMT